MKLQVIATGSRGNCYVLDDGYRQLILECGVSIKTIKKATNFGFSCVDGCLVTHSHKDHCKAVKELCEAGIDVYTSAGTAQEIGVSSHRIIEVRELFRAGNWQITPFDVIHDTVEPFGYAIEDVVGRTRAVFLTDSAYSPYVFNDLDFLMVECNHDYESLSDSVSSGYIAVKQQMRVMRNHFSLENCIEFIRVNQARSDRLRKIVLLHASDTNADTGKMVSEIQGETGIVTELAVAGKEIEL